jgi:hypothetical protein
VIAHLLYLVMKQVNNSKPVGPPYGISPGDKVTLYLNCFKDCDDRVRVDVQTLTVLYAIRFAECDDEENLEIVLVSNEDDSALFPLPTDPWSARVADSPSSEDDVSSSLLLPAVHVAAKNLCVAGLCAVVRFLIKRAVKEEGEYEGKKLLGHQGINQKAAE